MNRDIPTTTSPLRLAVVGGGAVGSTFAYYLARAGHEVTVVARANSLRLEQLAREGAVVLASGARAAVEVTDTLDASVAFDVVVVTTLAHQADAVLPALQQSRAKRIHFMFNTLEPERLRDAVGPDRCSFGLPFVMAQLTGEGRLDATVSSSRKTLHGERSVVDLFNEAGIASRYEPQMMRWLRCHVPLCVAIESIAATAEKHRSGATWKEARTVAAGLRAGFALLQARGLTLYPKSKKRLSQAPVWLLAPLFWGISRNRKFRELLATGAAECHALVTALTTASAAPPALQEAVRKLDPFLTG